MTSIPATVPPPPRGPVRRSRRTKWRAAVLVAVHVAIAVHVAHWLTSGSTLSPVEPSESMETLERGAVNAGFVFFVTAILATMILGRWFCGWACHLVAYQDLSAWLLTKLGVKPKPVRSRLLVWMPFGVAIYMFVWPTLLRWLDARPAPEMHAEFATTRLWDTFAGPGMAIITLLVCGALIVWWFGAKGFCTYGCPYGGLFGVADRFAPGRIRVTDACEGCRHCTATCTSNVLVHEEVLRHGMVVDPGCMKCFDCVDVCPKGALYFGFGKWSLGTVKRALGGVPTALDGVVFALVFGFAWFWIAQDPRVPTWFAIATATGIGAVAALSGRESRRFDFSRSEELAMALLFVITTQWIFRSLYGLVPFLLSIGLGAITAIVAIVMWRLVRRPELTFQHLTLRSSGRLTRTGVGFVAFGIAWLGFTAHSAFVQRQIVRIDALVAEAGTLPPPRRAPLLAQSLAHIETFDTWALRDQHTVRYQAANIAFNQGRLEDAERNARRALNLQPKFRDAWTLLADVRAYRGDRDGARRVLELWLADHPEDEPIQAALERLER